MAKILVNACPNCGANVSGDADVCEFCGSSYTIKNLSALAKMDRSIKLKYITEYNKVLTDNAGNIPIAVSLALCHIDAQNYEFALNLLKKLADNDCQDPNVFYYVSLAMLDGKKPRLHHIDRIRKVESYLKSAQYLSGGTFGLYYILQAAIKRDYYEYYLFNMNAGDNCKVLLERANNFELDVDEIDLLLRLLKLDDSDRTYFDSILAI